MLLFPPEPQPLTTPSSRTSVIKRHMRWVHEGEGWVETEFIHPVSWASKFQTIPDSAPHQIVEMRWLRDPRYTDNVIQQYTRGGVEKLTGITFTHYMHQAMLEQAQVTGDVPFLVSQLEGMISMYELWQTNRTLDPVTGLYHRTPLQDAQEYSLPGYLVGGPGGEPMEAWNDFGLTVAQGGGNDYGLIWSGPETYRPSFNAYMIAGARAIAQVADLAGNGTLARNWTTYADGLQQRMEDMLYSNELDFWIDVVEGTNHRCQGRELIGYYPYRFDVGTNSTYIRGLEAVVDTEHFLTEYGPTTLEQVNPYYTALKNSTYCCMWNGQSWPFSTSVYLITLARIAREGLSKIITPALFYDQLKTYTRTSYKEGYPYVAESHYPTIDTWSGDTTNHSENYFHSTYLDNIFTNLFGIVPSFSDELVLQPLVPENWTYFAIENLPYHGTLLTIVYDKTGSHYNHTNTNTTSSVRAGLSIYSNGTLFHHQSSLPSPGTNQTISCTLPFNSTAAATRLSSQPQWQNILANPNSPWNLPSVTSDYCLNTNGDFCPYPAWKLNDGLLWYDYTPDNRWTNNQSQTPTSTLNITLPRKREMSSISLAIMSDIDRPGVGGGVVACPEGLRVLNSKGETIVYENPWTGCVGNALNTLPFSRPQTGAQENASTPDSASLAPGSGYVVEDDFLQVILSDRLMYTTAVSEIQIWTPPNPGPRYEAEDGVIGTFIGFFAGRPTGLNGTIEAGGVTLHSGAWVELSDVRRSDGEAGKTSVTVVGGGEGTVEVGVNWMYNHTVSFNGTKGNRTIEAEFWRGGNWVDLFQTEGTPWVDAIVVGS